MLGDTNISPKAASTFCQQLGSALGPAAYKAAHTLQQQAQQPEPLLEQPPQPQHTAAAPSTQRHRDDASPRQQDALLGSDMPHLVHTVCTLAGSTNLQTTMCLLSPHSTSLTAFIATLMHQLLSCGKACILLTVEPWVLAPVLAWAV